MEGFGPHGEKIIEYTIHDAFASGFTHVVCVVRRSMESDFQQYILRNVPAHLKVSLAFQEIDTLPEGLNINTSGRQKPWGTAHALWCARQAAPEGPFAVVNADDFYGRAALQALADFLLQDPQARGRFAMVGYPLAQTLSNAGTVSRGVCSVDEKEFLKDIVEHTKIERRGDSIISFGEPHAPGEQVSLPEQTVVSMNCWGFSQDFWAQLTQWIYEFFRGYSPADTKKECYIPWAVWRSLELGVAQCSVLPQGQQWCGVTHPDDAPRVRNFLAQLTQAGAYNTYLYADLLP